MSKVHWKRGNLYMLAGCRGCEKDLCPWNNGNVTGDNSTKGLRYGCNSDKWKDEAKEFK